MNTERFTSQNNNEDDRSVIEIPKSVVKIGAVALATLGVAGVANALGLFYSPKSPEKGPSPAHQVAQVVENYSNGIITELPEDTEIRTVTLEEGENPTSVAETAMKEYNLVDTSSFPKDFATRNIANGIGWVEIPTTLEVNVKKLHEYLFQDQDYTPSATVSKISKQISKVTGTTEKSTQSQDNMY